MPRMNESCDSRLSWRIAMAELTDMELDHVCCSALVCGCWSLERAQPGGPEHQRSWKRHCGISLGTEQASMLRRPTATARGKILQLGPRRIWSKVAQCFFFFPSGSRQWRPARSGAI